VATTSGVGVAVELAEGVLGGVLALVDVLGVLAAGLVVDEVAALVDAALDLVAVLASMLLTLSIKPMTWSSPGAEAGGAAGAAPPNVYCR